MEKPAVEPAGGCLRRSRVFPPVAVIIVSAFLTASFFIPPHPLPGLNVCYFKALTGFPCPGCGLTRSICAISHGDPAAAFHLNPFGFFIYGILLLYLSAALLTRFAPGVETRILSWKRLFHPLILLFVGAMLLFGVYRIIAVLRAAPASI